MGTPTKVDDSYFPAQGQPPKGGSGALPFLAKPRLSDSVDEVIAAAKQLQKCDTDMSFGCALEMAIRIKEVSTRDGQPTKVRS